MYSSLHYKAMLMQISALNSNTILGAIIVKSVFMPGFCQFGKIKVDYQKTRKNDI
jgi:hypothetical protein